MNVPHWRAFRIRATEELDPRRGTSAHRRDFMMRASVGIESFTIAIAQWRGLMNRAISELKVICHFIR
jgi:hypothetical protein